MKVKVHKTESGKLCLQLAPDPKSKPIQLVFTLEELRLYLSVLEASASSRVFQIELEIGG